jgi:hypothetical protein
MDGLSGALGELARDVATDGPVDPASLWRRGRRRVRVRRALAGSAAVVLALLAVGLGAAGPEPRLISPAGSPHAPGIPDRVEDPPGWLPVGNVGPLSVLGVGRRHGQEQLFGIGADSGRYRYLDTGSRVPGTPVALSPNGRWVAYWAGHGGVVTSLGVLDTLHGTTSGLDGGSSTKQGLQPGPLVWLDDRTVLLEFGQRHRKGSSVVVPAASRQTETFRPDGDGPSVHVLDPNSGFWSRARDGRLLVPLSTPDPGGTEPVVFVGYDGSLDAVGTDFELPPGGYRSVSRSGDTVVALGYTGATGHAGLLSGTVPALGGVTALHDVGDLRVGTLLGWHSDHTILVTGWRHAATGRASLFEADVATGTVRRIGDAGDDVDVVAAMASDLVEKPLVEAHPPHGLDPGLVSKAAAGAVIAAVAGLLWWRRRGAA